MSDQINDSWDDFGEDLKQSFLAEASAKISKYVLEDREFSSSYELKEFLSPLVTEWQVDAYHNKMPHFGRFLKAFEAVLKSAVTSEQTIDTYLIQLNEYLKVLAAGEHDSEKKYRQAIKAGKGKQLYLHCYAGEHEFVIPIQHVLEFTTATNVYKLPDLRNDLQGMLSFRGESVPVVNLSHFGFQGNPNGKAKFFVICELMGIRVAIEVTKTADVLDLTDLEVQDAVESSLITSASFVSQFINRENKTILVFDLEKMVAA